MRRNFGLIFEALEMVMAVQTRFAYQLNEKHSNVSIEIAQFVEDSDTHVFGHTIRKGIEITRRRLWSWVNQYNLMK